MRTEATDGRPVKPGRLYRKLSASVWGDERFRRLSKPKPNAQFLWIYLLTGPHTTPLPGLFVAGQRQLAEALEWPPAALCTCLEELTTPGMVRADWTARVVWIPNALRHNPPDNPNVVRGWRKMFALLPECDLTREAAQAFRVFLANLGEPFAEPFSKPLVEPFAEPCPKQEQYQYQEQYREQEQEQKQDPPAPLKRRESDSGYADTFSIFWEKYPNKKAKGAAGKAWRKLNPDAGLLQKILDAVAAQVSSEAWTRDGGRFIPHPATWLNGQRWEDQAAQPSRPESVGRQVPSYEESQAYLRREREYDAQVERERAARAPAQTRFSLGAMVRRELEAGQQNGAGDE